MQARRSLKHDYEQYLEEEIEGYKASVPRTALLALGDEAAAMLRSMPDAELTDVVLCEMVDRIIKRRLKLPGYRTWRARYMERIAELQRPERWGFAADGALVRELTASRDGEHVLVAGADAGDVVLFSAALGCAVTFVGHEPDAVERTVAAAEASGLGRRVRAGVADLDGWMPDVGLRVAFCETEALARLECGARQEVLDALQRATLPGGAHFVRAPRGADEEDAAWVCELEPQYQGWETGLDAPEEGRPTFVARKRAR